MLWSGDVLVVLTHGFHAAWEPGFCLQRSQSVGDGRGMTYALVSDKELGWCQSAT